ncbi:MAG: sodium-dependent bicarbonate transport family permease [Planctomycetes bacterium]|nr:sodium-dependent bicarbonate transport family permease [Planctomycetota bacterium]
MDWSAALVNLQNPPSLFFLLGLLAPLLRCPLEIPAPVTKPIALYLLWAIGFKGGFELSHVGIDHEALATLLAAMRLAVPESEPSIYVAAALGVTFPWNIVFGLPLMQAGANFPLSP